jgi:Cof subfamily protein (haloacid dehalogenase superfamily)
MAIIFFDVDGTIYDGDPQGIRVHVKDAIHETQKKGHLCFICSGRPWGFISKQVKEIGFDGYVLANGAQIQYENKNLSVHYLEKEQMKSFINYFDERGFEYMIATPDATYLKAGFDYMYQFYGTCNIDIDEFIRDFDVDEVLSRCVKIEVYYRGPEEVPALRELAKDFFFLDQGSSYVGEISRNDVTKGTGIKETLEVLHIPVEESYCFGDGHNDVEMFKAVQHGIAMANAVDEIKAIATEQ